MSEPVGDNVFEPVLFPVAVIPPLASLIAPVVTATVLEAADVGVPVTGQLMLAPAATVAGGVGVHAPRLRPAGKPVTAHDAFVALAVAVALLVQRMVPL